LGETRRGGARLCGQTGPHDPESGGQGSVGLTQVRGVIS